MHAETTAVLSSTSSVLTMHPHRMDSSALVGLDSGGHRIYRLRVSYARHATLDSASVRSVAYIRTLCAWVLMQIYVMKFLTMFK
jgi:hypothetical protein